jgi:hypothetical protein
MLIQGKRLEGIFDAHAEGRVVESILLHLPRLQTQTCEDWDAWYSQRPLFRQLYFNGYEASAG